MMTERDVTRQLTEVVNFIARIPSLALERIMTWDMPYGPPVHEVRFWRTLGHVEDRYKVRIDETGIQLLGYRRDLDSFTLQADLNDWQGLEQHFHWHDHLGTETHAE